MAQQKLILTLVSTSRTIGMAIGPFVNMALVKVYFDLHIGTLMTIPVNPNNAAGLVMATGEVFLLGVMLVFLKEPPTTTGRQHEDETPSDFVHLLVQPMGGDCQSHVLYRFIPSTLYYDRGLGELSNVRYYHTKNVFISVGMINTSISCLIFFSIAVLFIYYSFMHQYIYWCSTSSGACLELESNTNFVRDGRLFRCDVSW